MIALVISMALSFIGMAVAVVFDKSRLIDFFYLSCTTLGRVTPCAMFYIHVIN